MLKTFILIATATLTLWAQQSVVAKSDLDLYQNPNDRALKKERHFQKGDRVEVYGCDRFGWCRVDRGYVKGYKLGLGRSTQTVVRSKSSAPAIVTEKIDLSLYEPHLAPEHNRSNTPTPTLSTSETPYTHYFEPKSARLNVHVTP